MPLSQGARDGKLRCLLCSRGPDPLTQTGARWLALTGPDLPGLQTPWKVLLGLLAIAVLVTVITVPVVLLTKDSKFKTFEKDKTVTGIRFYLNIPRRPRNFAGDWVGPVCQVLGLRLRWRDCCF